MRVVLRFSLFLVICALGMGACIFSPSYQGSRFSCKISSDCPTGMTCSPALGYCIEQSGSDGGNEACSPQGFTRVCYSGPPGTGGVGACRPGTQVCQGGFWGACQGEILPATETCDNKDNDCNGQVDDNCPCQNGNKRQCYPGPEGTLNQGSCRAGTQSCVNQTWGPCQGYVGPQEEVCDGQDNDCNGQVDDVPSRRCYTGPPPTLGRGACRSGTQTCQGGRWGSCVGQVLPQPQETCNNRQDDNCNGDVDEGCTGCRPGESRTCYAGPPGTQGRGTCRAGRQVCDRSGRWGSCTGQILPAPEACDGQDNDCNGQIDDGNALTRPCYTGPSGTSGQGICKPGTQKCQGGRWGTCVGEVTPQAENCDNIDNNCNGAVDEGCECVQGQTRACYSGPPQTKGVGSCKDGKQTCSAKREWGPCVGEVKPAKEDCNGVDDDCDGNVDGFSRRCYTGPPNTEGKGSCRAGAQTCKGGKWSPCQGEIAPIPEICNNKDDDCDGQIDDGLKRACYGGKTGCKSDGKGGYSCVGRCSAGAQTCSAGAWGACLGERQPLQESCNGVDDDCDGKVDGFQEDCYTSTDGGCAPDGKGGFRCKGSCQTGKRRCNNGTPTICVGQVAKQPESCDGKDNDCDGDIDEGCSCISGKSRDCYSGPTGTGGKGICKKGTQTCDQFGQWGSCVGQVLPKTETCNGVDDDCDGKVDGMTQGCYTGPASTKGKGACKDGTQTCKAGTWSGCVGEVKPTTEVCNGKDDDCDGKIDNNLTPPKCPKQQGVCQGSFKRCGPNGWFNCTPSNYGTNYQAIETTCDGLDNDCDGQVDGVGACGKCILSTKAATFAKTLPTSCQPTDACYDHCLRYQNQLYYCRKTHTGGYKYVTYTNWISQCNTSSACQTSTCGGQNFFCDGSRWRQGNKPGTNDDFCDGIDNNCNGKIDEDCSCQSPCTAARHCKSPCSKCVQQAGSPFPTCAP